MADFSPCPCCGRPMEKTPRAMLDELQFTGQQRIILGVLADNFGRWVPTKAVINELYRDAQDGGALDPVNLINAQVTAARKKLPPSMRIESKGGGPGGYSQKRMVWAE